MVIGIAMLMMYFNISGSNLKDFISEVLLKISTAQMLAGIYVTILEGWVTLTLDLENGILYFKRKLAEM